MIIGVEHIKEVEINQINTFTTVFIEEEIGKKEML